jgi:hypothetical protein
LHAFTARITIHYTNSGEYSFLMAVSETNDELWGATCLAPFCAAIKVAPRANWIMFTL